MSLDQDILIEFQKESQAILGELFSVLEDLEESKRPYAELLSEFSQKIDRIMGGAKTLNMMDATHEGLQKISKLTEICKYAGYKIAETGNSGLVPIVGAFWADVLEIVQNLLRAIDQPEKTRQILEASSLTLEKRLAWLSAKIAGATPTK